MWNLGPTEQDKSLVIAFCTLVKFVSVQLLFFTPQNYASMTHGFSPAPKDFSGLVECHPPTNFHLFELQTKAEMRCNIDDGSEDVDMEYMMEMPFESDNGNEAVCLTFLVYSGSKGALDGRKGTFNCLFSISEKNNLKSVQYRIFSKASLKFCSNIKAIDPAMKNWVSILRREEEIGGKIWRIFTDDFYCRRLCIAYPGVQEYERNVFKHFQAIIQNFLRYIYIFSSLQDITLTFTHFPVELSRIVLKCSLFERSRFENSMNGFVIANSTKMWSL